MIKLAKLGKAVTAETIGQYIISGDNEKIIQGKSFAKTFRQLMESRLSIVSDSCANLKQQYDYRNEQCTNGVRNALKLAECKKEYEPRVKKVDACYEKIASSKENLLKRHIGQTLTFEMPSGNYYYQAVDERTVWGSGCKSILESSDCMSKNYAARFANHDTLPNTTFQFKDKKTVANFEWSNQTAIDCKILGIAKWRQGWSSRYGYEFYCQVQKIRN